MYDHILISCLMVTSARAERFGFIQKSVAAYLAHSIVAISKSFNQRDVLISGNCVTLPVKPPPAR